MTSSPFVSDSELIAEVTRLAGCEHHATADLVAALAELDTRRLYLGQGCSSMFTYCTQVLHLAEHAAYNRIEAARAARRFPEILTLLADGSVHLSSVRLLAPHLTQENHAAVLRKAIHKSKREVEQIVARLQPQPDVVASVRKLPVARTAPALVEPERLNHSREQPRRGLPLFPRPRGPRSRHSFRNDIKCSSPWGARRTRTCGECRTCCVTAFRTVIRW